VASGWYRGYFDSLQQFVDEPFVGFGVEHDD
jgi:hypothetical protein